MNKSFPNYRSSVVWDIPSVTNTDFCVKKFAPWELSEFLEFVKFKKWNLNVANFCTIAEVSKTNKIFSFVAQFGFAFSFCRGTTRKNRKWKYGSVFLEVRCKIWAWFIEYTKWSAENRRKLCSLPTFPTIKESLLLKQHKHAWISCIIHISIFITFM